ncbi:MerR family transcriptional regulator [Niveibacterium umoris]|uniref:DNA-binding transcriptional MerR regulator n=1 Tax=Niveibacterium umoris TaxID=1193620 RepID=A0A840BM09_9RHOO|nr:MerR family transcriptional regulator [Niveibacterium umoris]MBB4012569.1 DNA-binding transcriptional MerR regulator [Niveibacterium umoris]
MEYTVGELAKRCGLTVRALHHYEKLKLLQPSGRSEAGYRLYAEADVLRLHRLLALRHSGLSLKEIGPLLDAENPPLLDVLTRHIAQVEAQVLRQQRLLHALRRIAERAERQEEGLTEQLLVTMGMMRALERYFDEEELKTFDHWRNAIDRELVRETEAEWPALIQSVRSAMAQGVDPLSPQVKGYAQRWMELVNRFTGPDENIRSKFATMYANETNLQRETGVTPELLAYLRRAVGRDTPSAAPAPAAPTQQQRGRSR